VGLDGLDEARGAVDDLQVEAVFIGKKRGK
jgi:hypothetical protein